MPRAIAVEGCRQDRFCDRNVGPWPGRPRLASRRKASSHPRSLHGERCPGGRLPGWCAGLKRSEVVLAGRLRLQKSTSGAWPIEAGANTPVHLDGSSQSTRERGRVNERRKPGRGGKAVRPVAGSCEVRKHRVTDTLRWKALRAGKAHRVDARRVEAVLVPRFGGPSSGLPSSGARQGASEVVFGGRARGR